MHGGDVSGISVRAKTSPVTLHTDSVRTEKLRTHRIFVFEAEIAIAKVKLVVQRNISRVELDL